MSTRSTIASFQPSGTINAPRPKTVLPTIVTQARETSRSLLTGLTSMGQPLSDSDIDRLESAVFANNMPVFDLSQKAYFYEWTNLLHDSTVIDVLDYLTSAPNAESAFWNMASLERARKDLEREIYRMQEHETGTRGVAKCGRCNSDNLGFSLSQTRSADEGFTVHYRCLDCGNRWTG